jgi:putative FmdB family regulatory protein
MPIYEYQRSDGSTFEVMQTFDDEPLTQDPDTGLAVRRVFHAPALHFKGKGFYNTDYGTRKREREAAAERNGSESSADSAGRDEKPARDAAPSAKNDGSSTSSEKATNSSEQSGSASKHEPVSAE